MNVSAEARRGDGDRPSKCFHCKHRFEKQHRSLFPGPERPGGIWYNNVCRLKLSKEAMKELYIDEREWPTTHDIGFTKWCKFKWTPTPHVARPVFTGNHGSSSEVVGYQMGQMWDDGEGKFMLTMFVLLAVVAVIGIAVDAKVVW